MISCSVDIASSTTIHRVRGAITKEELLEKAVEFVRDGPTRLALWDFTEAEFSVLSANGIISVFDKVRPFARNREGGKTALLFGSTAGFGLGRMSEAIAENMGYPYEFRSFSDLLSAIAWLNLETQTGFSSKEVAEAS